MATNEQAAPRTEVEEVTPQHEAELARERRTSRVAEHLRSP